MGGDFLRGRIIKLFGLLGICLGLSPTPVLADVNLTTSSMISVNNVNTECDYKLSDSELDSMHEKVLSFTDLKGVDKDETDSFKATDLTHDFTGLKYSYANSKETVNWLIKNNILSRQVKIDNGKVKVNKLPADNVDARKSDFYMMLYKAEKGVIEPNLVYSKKVAGRGTGNFGTTTPGDIFGSVLHADNYWDDGVNADFVGDYFVYKSPNVYELYLNELLRAGVINQNDLILDSEFSNEYKNGTGEWRVSTSSSVAEGKNGALGHSVFVDATTVSEKKIDYFTDESISLLDALGAIAKYMRQYENLSVAETSVIAYKYGLTELFGIDNEYKDDIYYLVGTGILTFDDNTVIDLSSDKLSQGQMYELMYRVANKGARYDFSKIQLTDSETSLADLGYSRTDFTLHRPKIDPICEVFTGETAEVSNDTDDQSVIASIFDVLNPSVVVQAASKEKLYKITLQFDAKKGKRKSSAIATGNVYVYHSESTKKDYVIGDSSVENSIATAVAELKYDSGKNEVETTDFKLIDLGYKTSNDDNIWGYRVTFNVYANTASGARKKLKSRISYKTKSNSIRLQGISKVEDETGNIVTLISQDSLKNINEISVLADKVLLNNKTGAQCLIQTSSTTQQLVNRENQGSKESTTSTSQGYALIGSQIFGGEDTLVTSQDNEVYYNLKILQILLSDAALNKLGVGSSTSINTDLIASPSVYQSMGSYSFERSGDSLTRKFSYIRLTSQKQICKNKSANGAVALYNTSSLSKGLNTISRTFDIKVTDPVTSKSKYEKFTFIVDWVYYAPIAVDCSSVKTIADYQQLVYTRPEVTDDSDGVALLNQNYWDRNYGVSNALANMMYSTRGITYIRSGYMVPKLTILLPEFKSDAPSYMKVSKDCKELFSKTPPVSDGQKNAIWIALENFFEENFAIDASYGKYLDNNQAGWWAYYYGGDKTTKVGADNVPFTWMETDTAFTSDHKSKMKSYYEAVGAARMLCAVGKTDKDKSGYYYSTKVDGASSSETIAYVSDVGCIYRNVKYPRGVIRKKYNNAEDKYYVEINKPFLTVKYSDKNKRLIKSIKIYSESDTGQGLNVNVIPTRGDKIAMPTLLNADKKMVTAEYEGTNTVGSKSYARFTQLLDPGSYLTFNKSDKMINAVTVPLNILNFNNKVGTRVFCTFTGSISGSKSYTERLNVIQKTIFGDFASIKSKKGVTYTEYKVHSSMGESDYSGLTQQSCCLASIHDLDESAKVVSLGEMGIGDSNNKLYFDCLCPDGSTNIVDSGQKGALYLFDDGLYAGVWKLDGDATEPRWVLSKLKKVDLSIWNNKGKLFGVNGGSELIAEQAQVMIWPRFIIKQSSLPDIQKSAGKKSDYYAVRQHYHKDNYTLGDSKFQIAAQQNLYTAGLNESVIQSLLASNANITPVSKLKEGYTLTIGDTKWVKKGKYWESYPISCSNTHGSKVSVKGIIKTFKEGNNGVYEEECYSAISKMFGGILISSGDMNYALANYVVPESAGLGAGYLGSNSAKFNKYTKAGILCKKDSKTRIGVLKADSESQNAINKIMGKTLDTTYKYVTFKMQFVEGTEENPVELYARPVNAKGTQWELVYAGIGFLNNFELALFNEQLNYNYDSTVSVEINKNVYEVSDAMYENLKTFKEGFSKNVAIDIFNLLRWAIVLGTIYLFFTCWIAYFVLTKGIGINIFEALLRPSRQGKGGIDVIKIMTFGIFNFDTSPSLSRLATVTAIFIVIDVIVAYIL